MADETVDIRVRLQNGRVVATEARAVAASVDEIGDAAQRSGTRVGAFSRTTSRMGPILMGVGKALGMATLYGTAFTGAVGAFATGVGLNFNATMEQNTVAFTQFLGSTKKAKGYLNELYKIAATTPFEFPDLVSGARRFLAFGFAAKESKKILQEVGDTAAGLGGGAEEIDRMVMAIGQMKAKGRIQTEELLQLAELGVPVFDYLSKGLKMSGDQLQDELRKGSVGFKEGLDAIRAGMRKDFGGMSKEQAKTFTGQLSTLKDNVTQMLGKMTKPLFNWLRRDVLPALNASLPGIQAWIKGAMGKLPGIFTAIKDGVESFIDAIKPAKPFLDNVLVPMLKGLIGSQVVTWIAAWKVGVPIFKAVMVVLGAVGSALKPLKGVIMGVTFAVGQLFGGGLLLQAVQILAKWGEAIGGAATWAAKLWWKLSPLAAIIRKLSGVFKDFAGAVIPVLGAAFGKAISIVTGWGAKWFNAGKGLASRLVAGVKWAVNGISSLFTSAGGIAANIGQSIIDWINDHTPFGDSISINGPGPLPDMSVSIPALAAGGGITSAGSVLVGEAGPEVLRLPRGASVNPLPRVAMEGRGGGGGFSERLIVVQLDGQEVGRRVERYASDKANRR